MHFRQFYVGCLAHASYLIGDQGDAVVVDPSRDIEMYLAEARANGLTIRWVLETHLHADFVSGHRELAQATGATIGIGARAGAAYAHRALEEGDEIRAGDVVLRALETPGHTPEHLSYLVFEHAGDQTPWGVLTGDTLFVGDVGRVDILSSRLPVSELAGLMYDSLHGKLLKLPDTTRVYPAHGAGSLCGRNIGRETWSTIGQQRMMNPALREMSREAFVAEITRDVPETPVYFLHSRDMNQAGPSLLAGRDLPPSLGAAAFSEAAKAGAIVVDTRATPDYLRVHIPSSLHVGLDGQYASWVGTLARPEDQPADRDRAGARGRGGVAPGARRLREYSGHARRRHGGLEEGEAAGGQDQERRDREGHGAGGWIQAEFARGAGRAPSRRVERWAHRGRDAHPALGVAGARQGAGPAARVDGGVRERLSQRDRRERARTRGISRAW